MSSDENNSANIIVIAVPTAGGRLCMHFGHCEQFTLIDVDRDNKTIVGSRALDPPPHEPGVLPKWLSDEGAHLVIAGGMGMRAQNLFAQYGVDVLVGAPADTPENLVRQYIEGTLAAGENLCDH